MEWWKAHIRSFVLPVAMLAGLLLHSYCGRFYGVVPYLVFTMLFLSYTAIDVRQMRVSRLDVWLMAFQLAFCAVCYAAGRWLLGSRLLADGLLVTALTPVAASSVVVSCALGARRETVTTYTIVDNLLVALVAPVIFAFIGQQEHLAILPAMWRIFCRIAPQIVFPFLTALLLQRVWPKGNAAIARHRGKSLYVWAVTLTIVLGKTFDNIILDPDQQWGTYGLLALLCCAQCALLFWVGKRIGQRFGEKVAGGQQLGQKNTSFGIWMAVEYLTPLSAFSMAFYSIAQNLFNSWQMYMHDRRGDPET